MNVRSIINLGDAEKYALGINVHVDEQMRQHFSFCILKREKDQITIEKSDTRIDHPDLLREAVSTWITKGTRININIEGRGILMRTLAYREGQVDADRLVEAFPGMKTDDLLSQQYVTESVVFIAMARKELLSTFEHFATGDVNWTGISFGPFVTVPVLNINEIRSAQVGPYRVDIGNGVISSVSVEETSAPTRVTVGDAWFEGDALLAYSSALQVFFPSPALSTAGAPLVEAKRDAWHLDSTIHHTSKLVGIVVMIFLVLNVSAFLWLNGRVEEAKTNLTFLRGKSARDEQVGKTMRELAKFSIEHGWEQNTTPLYYADKLGKSVTASIQLTDMEIGVFDADKLKREKRQVFDPVMIRVAGMAESPMELNAWLETLRHLPWVGEVSGEKYQYDQRARKGSFDFMIRIRE